MTKRGTGLEVLLAFLRLGCVSFGGPVAHLGYFRAEFVGRRQWLDERSYADLVGLCQFLPGPASSQVGFSIGLLRGGWLGGVAAWVGFTLPSALLLVLFAYGARSLQQSSLGAGLLHGLMLAAVAVVAQAVWGMARSLCPDRVRASIATLALVVTLLVPGGAGQLAAIALGAVGGLVFCRDIGVQAAPNPMALPVSRRGGAVCLTAFFVLLAISFIPGGGFFGLFGAFYRSGALVFGGGHVVLPLLHDAVVSPGWVSDSLFTAGYGATQTVPGPVFAFAAYLGLASSGLIGAALALVAIFLPGLLLVAGVLPFWSVLRQRVTLQTALLGVNAGVVGLLGAALYDPIWVSAVNRASDVAIVIPTIVLLTVWRTSPLVAVAFAAAGGLWLAEAL